MITACGLWAHPNYTIWGKGESGGFVMHSLLRLNWKPNYKQFSRSNKRRDYFKSAVLDQFPKSILEMNHPPPYLFSEVGEVFHSLLNLEIRALHSLTAKGFSLSSSFSHSSAGPNRCQTDSSSPGQRNIWCPAVHLLMPCICVRAMATLGFCLQYSEY